MPNFKFLICWMAISIRWRCFEERPQLWIGLSILKLFLAIGIHLLRQLSLLTKLRNYLFIFFDFMANFYLGFWLINVGWFIIMKLRRKSQLVPVTCRFYSSEIDFTDVESRRRMFNRFVMLLSICFAQYWYNIVVY